MGKTMILELDTGSLQTATVAVSGLDKALLRLGRSLNFILMGQSLGDYMQTALEKTGKVDDELLVMRLALGKLRVAIGEAFAPIAQVVLPAINNAIFATLRFVRMVGRITNALFGIKESASDAADEEYDFATAVTASSKAVQKSLAGFDRLNRLQAQSGGGSVTLGGAATPDKEPYNPKLNWEEFVVVGVLKNMWQTLKQIDLRPIREAFQQFKVTLLPVLEKLGESFLWLYQFVLVPVAKWAAESLLPKVLETLSVALDALSATIEACKPALLYLWENFLVPLGQWMAQHLLDNLDNLQTKLTNIGIWMSENQVSVAQLLLYASALLGKIMPLNDVLELLNVIGVDTNEMLAFMQSLLANMSPVIGNTGVYMDALQGKVSGLGTAFMNMVTNAGQSWSSISEIWKNAGSWFRTQVWEPLKSGTAGMSNGILRILNKMGSHLSTGFNGLFDSLNDISLTIPDWVPVIGGKTLGFSLGKVRMPQIPQLAKGAVLPANKPFLAMVGDQRHGTNVEAPLQTIRDAVKLELGDLMEGSIAGQEATVSVLRQILEAVLGISLTDGDVGAAAERYRSRMAVVHGF